MKVMTERPRGRRVGDWLTLRDGTHVRLGLRVYHASDPTHVGRIEKIWNSSRVTLRWERSGWITEGEAIADLIAATEDE